MPDNCLPILRGYLASVRKIYFVVEATVCHIIFIAILRKELIQVLPAELPAYIALQNNDTDKNYFLFITKLRDKRSFLDEGNFDKVFKERGIFIDIFPLDRLLPWTQRLRVQSVAYNISARGTEATRR